MGFCNGLGLRESHYQVSIPTHLIHYTVSRLNERCHPSKMCVDQDGRQQQEGEEDNHEDNKVARSESKG